MNKSENQKELTYGEKAVEIDFNPSSREDVEFIKKSFANLINQMDSVRTLATDGEQKRLCSVAITEMQAAQMWAIKSITYNG